MNLNNTKADVIIDLQQRGYDNDFILKSEGLLCIQHHEMINPDQFEISESYRFDGKTKPCDNFIIYAIRSLNDDVKGILMTSYSALTRGMSVHLWSKLSVELR